MVFFSGKWITDFRYSQHTLAIIAAGAWFIWLGRCNAIFKNITFNQSTIVNQAIAHTREFNCFSDPLGKKLLLYNFNYGDGNFLFFHAIGNSRTQVRSTGFFIANSNYKVILAGCISQSMLDNSLDELFALEVAMQTVLDFNIRIKNIFCDHHGVRELIWKPDLRTAWRFCPQISNLKFLLDCFNQPNLHVIPADWMTPAINLASIGFNYHHLNLFLGGKDLPYWVMRSFIKLGFIF